MRSACLASVIALATLSGLPQLEPIDKRQQILNCNARVMTCFAAVNY